MRARSPPARAAARGSARRSSSCRCRGRPRRPRSAAGWRSPRRGAGGRRHLPRPAAVLVPEQPRLRVPGRPPIAVAPFPEQPSQPVVEHPFVDALRRVLGEHAQVRRDAHLLAPVAIQVQPRAHEPQRPAGRVVVLAGRDERARREGSLPFRGLRPRQRREVDGLVEIDGRLRGDRSEVDVDVAEARPADGQRDGERERQVRLAARERGQSQRHVDVGCGEHAGVIELAQRRGRLAHAASVMQVGGLDHGAPPRSSTSLSATTKPGGGFHANTPHGLSPTTGVAGPLIPRKKRYRTPARLRSGS